jgi:hypothetical protein
VPELRVLVQHHHARLYRRLRQALALAAHRPQAEAPGRLLRRQTAG